MASLDSALTRSYLKKGTALYVSDDTVAGSGPVAIRLRYVGTGTVTSVTVTTGTDIVTVTSDGGTDTYLFATYTTVGTLVDAINAAGIFEAKVVDSLRSLDSATQFKDGAITAGTLDGISIWDVLVDTSAALYIAGRLTYDRGFLKAHKKNHRVALQEIKYLADVGSTDYVYVYEVDGSGTETLVYKVAGVDNTATTINFASGVGKITAEDNDDLVVVVKGTSTFANACYLQLVGEIE